jgi:hypothetical protein
MGLATILIMGVPTAGQAGDEAAESTASDAPFYLNAGIGFAYIGESIATDYLGQNFEMKVDNDIYPVLRFGHAGVPGPGLIPCCTTIWITTSESSIQPLAWTLPWACSARTSICGWGIAFSSWMGATFRKA